MTEKTVWGIHAGSSGEADNLFIKSKVIALGWSGLGDLTKYKTRDEYKNKLKEIYKDILPGAIPTTAGMFFRFVYEMQIGDVVIYPSKISKQIHIGEVISGYGYSPDIDNRFAHQHKVDWKTSFPRTRFSQEALYEIGSALSLFQVKNYADEFLDALAGKSESTESGETLEDDREDIAGLTENFEQQAKDFVLKQLKKNYKGEALEVFVVHLLEKMGYHARQTPKNTPSVDVIAHKDEFGFENPIIKCQVKSEEGTINLDPVEKLCSRVKPPNEYGLFICLSDYNSKAVNFAESQSNLRLINGYELVDIVLDYYELLDTKYKNTIPLNKVFLPSIAR